ncbi:MAG: hypothetical protein GX558_04595 [Clostridiales bacterium]|nr:hypothetical protein [Clostridiales bacterium]
MTNRGAQKRRLTATAYLDLLMGVSREDARLTRAGAEGGFLWAMGTAGGLGFSSFVGQSGRAAPGRLPLTGERMATLSIDLEIAANQSATFALAIGVAHDLPAARALVDSMKKAGPDQRLAAVVAAWDERLARMEIETPDEDINRMVNRWLPYQALSARVWGRAGYYQAGGAYGFRDQLQDMLALIPYEPALAREHLLLCAAHQFEDGDVQHWWHPERTGVRTRISDDLLFLPFVTAAYVRETGDEGVLDELAPYLRNVAIPEGQEDWYGEAQLSDDSGTLRDHCLRAFRRAARVGRHGLLLMGSGDWNDGMNRLGHQGMGESVWLTEFAAVAASDFAPLCGPAERDELLSLAARLREAIEKHGWDGDWYLRAYADDGAPIGSHRAPEGEGCRIDAIAQCWAVAAGLDRLRSRAAMAQVSGQLIDRERGIIKLLTPPFDGDSRDPGYIRGYPPGVRENGGQYTHAACWVVMALADLGLNAQAWEAFEMLMPYSHADTREKLDVYRVEPYAIAADVYGEPPHAGRGGWTWYTGSAAWMVRVCHSHLMGYARRGDYATLSALLRPDWAEASVVVRAGAATYRLTARRGVTEPTLDGRPLDERGVRLVDDGRDHQALFPPRDESEAPMPQPEYADTLR